MASQYHYKFKDTTTNEIIDIFIPVFGSYKQLSQSGYSSLQALDTAVGGDLDYVATLFCSDVVEKSAMSSLSGGRIDNYLIDISQYAGHTWEMVNDPTRTISIRSDGAMFFNINNQYKYEILSGFFDVVSFYSLESFSGGSYEEDYVNVIYYITFDSINCVNYNYPTSGVSGYGGKEAFEEYWNGTIPEDSDPFTPGGPSGDGGGEGDFDNTSDTIPFPNDPPISATDTGFMTVFATNLAGVQSLAASLWSDLFDAVKPGGSLEGTVEALKNIVSSPYDAILGCSLLPFPVSTSGSKNVKLYGVLPSSVSLPVAASQWKTIDCGTLNVHEFWGAYLDYAPYTKVTSMYLPYIGVVSIDVDMIMAKTIGVKYKCDIITGQCIAIITINGSCEFSYQGQCSVPIPITSIDWSSTVNAGLGLIGSVTGIVGTAVGGALGGGGAFGALAGGVKGAMGEAGAIAQNVMNSKPDIKSGGGVGGSAGQMGIQTPFLIIERPKQSLPSTKGSDGKTYSQNHWTGYPSNIATKLGSLRGYTEVSRVFINRTSATAEEKREIEELLYGGVYL